MNVKCLDPIATSYEECAFPNESSSRGRTENGIGKLEVAATMEKSPIAFLSYAHKDDQHGRVSELRTRLGSEVEMATGAEFRSFRIGKIFIGA